MIKYNYLEQVTADVIIRCYLIYEAISNALDQLDIKN